MLVMDCLWQQKKKKAGLLHRTAQPPTLAAFRPWEGSAGAGRVRPAGRKGKGLEA